MTDKNQLHDQIAEEVISLKEVGESLEIFVAGCKTGGNFAGAELLNKLRWRIAGAARVIAQNNNSLRHAR